MNTSGNAYGLTVLSPIKNGSYNDISHATLTRDRLHNLPLHTKSPMAKVPNTYLCRFYVLDDVFYQGKPAIEEHLKSKYIVFSTNFHGDRDEYLTQMWLTAEKEVRHIWQFCYGFDQVNDAAAFVEYIKKCQVESTLFFNGSTDDSLAEQLKGLYLKQELSKFAFENQCLPEETIQQNFKAFVERTEPKNLAGPTWVPGAATLEDLEDGELARKKSTNKATTEPLLDPEPA
jgi:hypothetical protein